ncbi:MAG: HD domain-containing protein [Candidatus Coatesbacteria bacterium]|nr:HD domain-containing protein [Candidatus Coatesbacteria bacterium]
MRNQQNLSQVKAGDNFKGFLMLYKIYGKTSKIGKLYANLELGDATGTIEGRWWDIDKEIIENFSEMQPVAIKGSIEEWQDKLQFKVEKMRAICEEDELHGFDFALLVPTTPYNVDEMWGELIDIITEIAEPNLQDLLGKIFARYEEDFKSFPAAHRLHHSYRGGLLEHTLSVVKIVKNLCEHFPRLDRDLVLTGAILHDIGKIKEYREDPRQSSTMSGELIGHVVQGWEIILDEYRQIEYFPENLLIKLGHIILSHHGKYEYGSPKLPKTAEAIVVNFADDLDAKVSLFYSVIDNDKDKGEFTYYNQIFEGRLYRG